MYITALSYFDAQRRRYCRTAQAVCRECAWRLKEDEDDEGVTCERMRELDPCSRRFRDEVCWTTQGLSAQLLVSCRVCLISLLLLRGTRRRM